jgi:hypothetical protein
VKRAASRVPPKAVGRPAPTPRQQTLRLLRNVVLCLLPVWAVWSLLTPGYNRFLLGSAENLVHLTESPDVTDLLRHPDNRHDGYIARRDFPPKRTLVHVFRITDAHFHLVLLAALFLGVPGIPWREKLGNLGVALLVAVFFHLFLLLFLVKSVYATELGAWSLTHYGPFARNAYGLAEHLFDLPFKLALPLVLWAAFYLRVVTGGLRED